MENANEIVGCRMVGSLLVVVVEAIEAGDHDPDRERQDRGEKDVPLKPSADQPNDDECQREPENVRHDEHASNEPAPPASSTGRRRGNLLVASPTDDRHNGRPRRYAAVPTFDPY